MITLFILTLPGCRDATGTHENISEEDLIGSWSLFHQILGLSLTTNTDIDIVDSGNPGTGYLTVNDQRVALNFVKVFPPTPWFDRSLSDYGTINVSNYPWHYWDLPSDTWSYTIIDNWYFASTLQHSWDGDNPGSESWYNYNPGYTFSGDDFMLNLSDTLTHLDQITMIEDTVFVSGTVTAAKIHLPANHLTQVWEEEAFPAGNGIITFRADSTFSADSLDFLNIEDGTWAVEYGVLRLTYIQTDWNGIDHTVDLYLSASIHANQLTLEGFSDACEIDPDMPQEDCIDNYAWQYWPLESSDITEVLMNFHYELEKFTAPEADASPETQ